MLGDRDRKVLEDIAHNVNITSRQISEKYDLSRSQLLYAMKKINSWLSYNNYPTIKRTNRGNFIVANDLKTIVSKEEQQEDIINDYVLNEQERKNILLLMLLCRVSEFSLVDFSSELMVSQATITKDLKSINQWINREEMEVKYTREKGYELLGEEWKRRDLLMRILQDMKGYTHGLQKIHHYSNISDSEVKLIASRLEHIEYILQREYTDEQFLILPYLFVILLRRIRNGYIIPDDFGVKCEELFRTREYELSLTLVGAQEYLPEVEKLYITLQLLASKVNSVEPLTKKQSQKLEAALQETLMLFEIKACIQFGDLTKLLKHMMVHMRSAYYRIKYNMVQEDKFLENACEEYSELLTVVKSSIAPLEKYIGVKIPDPELYYLAVFIGGNLIGDRKKVSITKQAIVVCPSGSAVSRMMDYTLRNLFPEFSFFPPVSIREFKKMSLQPAIVFSLVPLQTEKNLFVVEKNLSEYDKYKLRERVIGSIFDVGKREVEVDKILDIVERFADVKQLDRLRSSLEDYIAIESTMLLEDKEKKRLKDIVSEEHIVFQESVEGWEQAIRVAAQPLLNDQIIQQEYIEEMIQMHDTKHPYILLGVSTAIPHAAPNYGSKKAALGILKLREPVDFGGDSKIQLVVVVATDHYHTHVNPLVELMNVVTKKESLQKLLQCKDAKSLIGVIQE